MVLSPGLRGHPRPSSLFGMGRKGLVLMLAAASCVGTAGISMAGPKPVPGCGPSRAATLIEGRRARVYSLPGGGEPVWTTRVYGCLFPKGSRDWQLSPRDTRRSPRLLGKTVLLNAPWSGGVMRTLGGDSFILSVRARNLRTGSSNECEVGARAYGHFVSHVASVAKVVLSPSGTLAWSGYGVIREYEVPASGVQYFPPSTPYFQRLEIGKEVVRCSADSREVLDSGEKLNLASITLRGSKLTWTNAGQPKTSQLP
jgi:hypothetical protein